MKKSFRIKDHQQLCKLKKKEARGEMLKHHEKNILAINRMHFGNRRIKMGARAMHLLPRDLMNEKLKRGLATMGLLDAVERLCEDKGVELWNTAKN